MNLLESIRMAFESIKANKMRTFLTMLGIIIGISSVITIVSLGRGGQETIMEEFEKLGSSTVNINVDTVKAEPSEYITLKDVQEIKERVDSVKYVSPQMQKVGAAASDRKTKRIIITGGTPDLQYINNAEMLYGRYFNQDEYDKGEAAAVINEDDAESLFGYSDAVGESLMIKLDGISRKVTIVGVQKGYRDTFKTDENIDMPAFAYVPITFLSSVQTDELRINQITVVANSKEDIESAGNGTVRLLELRHNNLGSGIYTAQNFLTMIDQINNIMGIFTTFISAVAAISLLVGGIGVMNIMLVSVTERTREIGIRKAIGATTRHILMQFLIESVIIALIGGIIGMTVGIIGAFIIGYFVDIIPSLSLGSILIAILFSSAVGIFFGIYPAKKAAALDPIEALRYE